MNNRNCFLQIILLCRILNSTIFISFLRCEAFASPLLQIVYVTLVSRTSRALFSYFNYSKKVQLCFPPIILTPCYTSTASIVLSCHTPNHYGTNYFLIKEQLARSYNQFVHISLALYFSVIRALSLFDCYWIRSHFVDVAVILCTVRCILAIVISILVLILTENCYSAAGLFHSKIVRKQEFMARFDLLFMIRTNFPSRKTLYLKKTEGLRSWNIRTFQNTSSWQKCSR